MTFELQGRGAFGGRAEGEALVCPESIQGWAGISDVTGRIIEHGHSQWGRSIDGKILVLPCSKGSNGWSCHFNSAMVSGFKPAGWVFTKVDSRAGVAIAVLKVPALSDLNGDPCQLIRTGDYVRMDGDSGRIEVIRKGE